MKIKKKKKRSDSDKYVCFGRSNQPIMDGVVERFLTMTSNKDTVNYVVDPESFGGSDFPSWEEEQKAINDLYQANPVLINNSLPSATNNYTAFTLGSGFRDGFKENVAWIQTFSGRRFNPTDPNPDAIVIQDIAHALSMQCRFSGHCQEFYSVAQHSVYVSHICNTEDALWGLLHDASETYLVDIPRPLKHSGKFGAYIEMESVMQLAICQRFGLDPVEPPSVKVADKILLATEARDLMGELHCSWRQSKEPLPFKIESWSPKEAEAKFLDRFSKLIMAR